MPVFAQRNLGRPHKVSFWITLTDNTRYILCIYLHIHTVKNTTICQIVAICNICCYLTNCCVFDYVYVNIYTYIPCIIDLTQRR
jgi:hypothetical protein